MVQLGDHSSAWRSESWDTHKKLLTSNRPDSVVIMIDGGWLGNSSVNDSVPASVC
jgi:hypothetical protein